MFMMNPLMLPYVFLADAASLLLAVVLCIVRVRSALLIKSGPALGSIMPSLEGPTPGSRSGSVSSLGLMSSGLNLNKSLLRQLSSQPTPIELARFEKGPAERSLSRGRESRGSICGGSDDGFDKPATPRSISAQGFPAMIGSPPASAVLGKTAENRVLTSDEIEQNVEAIKAAHKKQRSDIEKRLVRRRARTYAFTYARTHACAHTRTHARSPGLTNARNHACAVRCAEHGCAV